MRRFLLGLTMLLLAAGPSPDGVPSGVPDGVPSGVPDGVLLRGVDAARYAALLGGLLAPSAASAQDAADARTRARAAYTEGQRLFEAGDFSGALAKFEEAYGIVNNPVVLLGVASAQERLGRLPEARATLERYLRERADAPDRADVERRIAALPAPAPAVEAVAPPVAAPPAPGAVSATAEPAGTAALTSSPTADESATDEAGADEASADEAGADEAGADEASADEAGADEAGADEAGADEAGDDGAAPGDAPVAATEPSAATWILTAVAGASLVTGTVFGFLALSRQSDFDVLPTRSLADEGEAFALAADLAFGVATAAGITAIVLYAIDRPAAPAAEAPDGDEDSAEDAPAEGEARAALDLRVMPVIGPTIGGAAMSVNF
jgi:hypothetical protein